MQTIETTIFSNLVQNHDFFVRVIPYLKEEYFPSFTDKVLLKLIKKYSEKYHKVPSQTALDIQIEKLTNLTSSDYTEIKSKISNLSTVPEDLEWLVDETENYCQQQAMNNALEESIVIKQNSEKPVEHRDPKIQDLGYINDIMKQALSVSFNSSLGLEFFEKWDERFTRYRDKAAKIPFLMNILNYITKGGVERGTLNVILAGVNVGKSLALCHMATEYLLQGSNVLYISMEMSQESVSKRIEANMIDVSLDDFDHIEYGTYDARMKKAKDQCGKGRLFIKQFPTGSANANHFNALMNELKLKSNFKADVVIIDYLGICSSTRIRFSENSYQMVKSIAEELRGLAIEQDVAIWTGAQTTRSAWGSSNINMEDTAESAGLPATCDLMLGVIETEDTITMGQQLVKQIKSRYGDKSIKNMFNIAVNKGLQRWSEIDDSVVYTPPDIKKEKTKSGFMKPVREDKTPKVPEQLKSATLDENMISDGEISW